MQKIHLQDVFGPLQPQTTNKGKSKLANEMAVELKMNTVEGWLTDLKYYGQKHRSFNTRLILRTTLWESRAVTLTHKRMNCNGNIILVHRPPNAFQKAQYSAELFPECDPIFFKISCPLGSRSKDFATEMCDTRVSKNPGSHECTTASSRIWASQSLTAPLLWKMSCDKRRQRWKWAMHNNSKYLLCAGQWGNKIFAV